MGKKLSERTQQRIKDVEKLDDFFEAIATICKEYNDKHVIKHETSKQSDNWVILINEKRKQNGNENTLEESI